MENWALARKLTVQMDTRIFDTDTPEQTAKKIFNSFDVLQSCTITGYIVDPETEDVDYKADKVLEELIRLDKVNNFADTRRGMQRVSRRLKNSIGGLVAQKIFRYERNEGDGKCSIRIWRVQ